MPPSALRDRKRERTRRALYEAAVELFESRGYEATTVADIAAAAEVGTRTFFNYFASKEELLFPEPDERVSAAARAIAARRPEERPVEVLLRALRAAGDNPGDHLGDTLAARIAVVRAQVSRTVPAVSGRAAYAQLSAQQEIAKQLRTAFPDELDEVGAAALVGAVVGAVSGALTVLFQTSAISDPEELQRKIQETTSKVLAPWLTAPAPASIASADPDASHTLAMAAAPRADIARSPQPGHRRDDSRPTTPALESVRPVQAVPEPDRPVNPTTAPLRPAYPTTEPVRRTDLPVRHLGAATLRRVTPDPVHQLPTGSCGTPDPTPVPESNGGESSWRGNSSASDPDPEPAGDLRFRENAFV
ncbi:TetR/AcrR family transcriptional regulator [Nocardia sp. NPDC058058]|uniref:TetR/AcrR family transcriptional regulator n=1 Tax=Nocardia sp. NPDC058058 TaxID=3346317 RepID=UPI0036DDEEAA